MCQLKSVTAYNELAYFHSIYLHFGLKPFSHFPTATLTNKGATLFSAYVCTELTCILISVGGRRKILKIFPRIGCEAVDGSRYSYSYDAGRRKTLRHPELARASGASLGFSLLISIYRELFHKSLNFILSFGITCK